MSFEGYYQILCRNGHQGIEDCGYCGLGDPCFTPEHQVDGEWEDADGTLHSTEIWKCPMCGEVAGWWNLVDNTNCEKANRHELVEVSPAEYKTCDMGCAHVVKHPTYKPGGLLRPELYEPDYIHEGHYVNGGLK